MLPKPSMTPPVRYAATSDACLSPRWLRWLGSFCTLGFLLLGSANAAVAVPDSGVEVKKDATLFQSEDARDKAVVTTSSFDRYMELAEQNRARGYLINAERGYFAAGNAARNLSQQVAAAGELGALYMQMRRYPEARRYLGFAHDKASGEAKLRFAVDLGNLEFANPEQRNAEQAEAFYREARTSQNPATRATAGINLARVAPQAERIARLEQALADVAAVNDEAARARLQLGVASLASKQAEKGLEMAYFYTRRALLSGEALKDRRIQLIAYDLLSRLYENQNSDRDSMLLTMRGLQIGDATSDQDILLQLQWRRGRLLAKRGELAQAIGAYQDAVNYIQEIRLDIPIDYEDGRSSFRETLGPIYIGLADLLLKSLDQNPDASPELIKKTLYRARDLAELMKQSELQDYLGDRCTVETAQASVQGTDLRVDQGTAIYYPIVFPDRLELLVETADGIRRSKSLVDEPTLRRNVFAFANALRNGETGVRAVATALYGFLMQPVVSLLEQQRVDRLVVVPDGVLRLVPFSALYDGKQYVVERFSVATASGLSLTQAAANSGKKETSVLIAGLSDPGQVVQKLYDASINGIFSATRANTDKSNEATQEPPTAETAAQKSRGLAAQVKTRDISRCFETASQAAALKEGVEGQANFASVVSRGLNQQTAQLDIAPQSSTSPTKTQAPSAAADESDASKARAIRVAALREELKLPGVDIEVNAIRKVTSGKVLLNNAFTLKNFSREVESGDYNIVHIASHGLFGGTADNSFLLADDELITMNDLQRLLKSGALERKPIDLLTLSACETAEGDDRAPLGISGAALKARARSAIGTLWPVSDDAAKAIMTDFYGNVFRGDAKDASLREAQLKLVHDPKMNNPFFWAPFIIVGNWH